MQRCPIQGCGRQFQNQLTMLQHVKRRHPQQSEKIRQQTTNEMLEKQNRITQELNKLPKMQRVIQMSKEKKPLEFQRRSSSKNKKQLGSIIENSQVKLSEIITESRQLVEQNTSSRKLLKRPSLSKKATQQADKLPTLTQSKVKKLKLESLKSDINASTVTKQSTFEKLSIKNDSLLQKDSQSAMYSTAQNFAHQMNKKMQLIRSRGKKQGQSSNRSSSKDIKEVNVSQSNTLLHKKRLSTHTMETLIQSQRTLQGTVKPIQRPVVKKLLQRGVKKDNSQSILNVTQDLTQSTFIEKSDLVQQKKEFSFQPKKRPLLKQDHNFTKKTSSPSSGSLILHPTSKHPTASPPHLQPDHNWHQTTVTIRNVPLSTLTLPESSPVEHLFLTNCSLHTIDLNECFSLTSLTLTNNHLSSFGFLEPTMNGSYQNLEALYVDHNEVRSLETIPMGLGLKRLSLAFNGVEGVDALVKVLGKLTLLEELDLAFNPVRKEANYKLAVLAACKRLKKLDGMVVTKFDRQLAAQYHKMYFDYLQILPLSSSPIPSDKFRPSTAVSITYQQSEPSQPQPSQHQQMSDQQLAKEIQILEKMIRTTKDQFQIIREENSTLQEEIQTYEVDLNGQETKEDQGFNPKVYRKLCREVEELEMLNFLQFAEEKELEEILFKKCQEKGLSLEMLTAN